MRLPSYPLDSMTPQYFSSIHSCERCMHSCELCTRMQLLLQPKTSSRPREVKRWYCSSLSSCGWMPCLMPTDSCLMVAGPCWLLFNAPGSCWLLFNAPDSCWMLLTRAECSWMVMNAPYADKACWKSCSYTSLHVIKQNRTHSNINNRWTRMNAYNVYEI